MTRLRLALVLSSTIALTNLLGGCSSTPTEGPDLAQYCYTDEKITLEDNTVVNSRKVVECSDKPKLRHFVKDAGIAQQCRTYNSRVVIKGNVKYVQGYLCQFADGTWQAVDGRYRY